MNRAADQALQDKRRKTERHRYDDFLNLVNSAAQQRYVDADDADADAASSSPSFDKFLSSMKRGADQAFDEQRAIPSYDHFLTALKLSGEQALAKKSREGEEYKEFLFFLKKGAQKELLKKLRRQQRVQRRGGSRAQGEKLSYRRANGNPLDQLAGKKGDPDAD